MDTKEIQALSFEDGYDRLEELIEQLETGKLSLEESMALYEEGVELARHCEHKLDDAELRVITLLNEVAEEEDREHPWPAE